MSLGAARLFDRQMCPRHGGGQLIGMGSPRVFIEGRNAIVLADRAPCTPGGGTFDLVTSGAAKVRAHGLPMARRTDVCLHHGPIIDGSEKVFIGGPTFAIPPNFEIMGDADYQNRVIRDLYLYSLIPTGRELLSRLEKSGKTVRIAPEDGNRIDHEEMIGDEIIILYDSTSHDYSNNPDRSPSPIPPQIALGHELIHGLHDAEGTTRPPGEKDMTPDGAPSDGSAPRERPEAEESETSGTGSGRGKPMTENQLRKELGLPEREDYLNPTYPSTRPEEMQDLRPGKP